MLLEFFLSSSINRTPTNKNVFMNSSNNNGNDANSLPNIGNVVCFETYRNSANKNQKSSSENTLSYEEALQELLDEAELLES